MSTLTDRFSDDHSFKLSDFTLKDQLGMGRFGTVYKAINNESDKVVALKIIAKKNISTKILYKQLQRQIEIQSRLKHPSICELYAYFVNQNNVFILLQYCSKGSLAIPIKQNKEVLTDKKIASIFLQLVEGIAFMHQRHVMHRDLKLQNILLDQFYNVKISDFGWCIHHPSQRNTFCGTMEYIAPQMLNKQKYQHSIDIYCVGIVLYELFYFKSPFVGQNQEQTFNNIKQRRLKFDDNIRLIPNQAKDLIERLLSQDPLDRPKANTLFDDPFVIKYLHDHDRPYFKRRFTEQTFQKWRDQNIHINQREEESQKENYSNSEKENIIIKDNHVIQDITQPKANVIQSEIQKNNQQLNIFYKICSYLDQINEKKEQENLYPSLQQNVEQIIIQNKIDSPKANSQPQNTNPRVNSNHLQQENDNTEEDIYKICQSFKKVEENDD